MTKFVPTASRSRARRLAGPAIALAAFALSAQAAFAVGGQAKPQLKIEADRSPQGARINFIGKGWPSAARIKLTGTRAPGSNSAQDFGMISADSTGAFNVRKVAGCTTNNDDDTREQVTLTAADSASGAKVSARVEGAAWRCI